MAEYSDGHTEFSSHVVNTFLSGEKKQYWNDLPDPDHLHFLFFLGFRTFMSDKLVIIKMLDWNLDFFGACMPLWGRHKCLWHQST